jgi:hypothetical protein
VITFAKGGFLKKYFLTIFLMASNVLFAEEFFSNLNREELRQRESELEASDQNFKTLYLLGEVKKEITKRELKIRPAHSAREIASTSISDFKEESQLSVIQATEYMIRWMSWWCLILSIWTIFYTLLPKKFRIKPIKFFRV